MQTILVSFRIGRRIALFLSSGTSGASSTTIIFARNPLALDYVVDIIVDPFLRTHIPSVALFDGSDSISRIISGMRANIEMILSSTRRACLPVLDAITIELPG